MSIKTRALSGGIGMEILDIDLSRELAPEVFAQIKQAYLDNVALLFRAQSLDAEAQIRFTELFAPAISHPLNTRASVDGYPQVLILQNQPGKRGARNDYWHSDISHMQTPPSATILQSLKVPENRGDTMICNMFGAWDQLSTGMQAMLRTMRAEHSPEASIARSHEADTDAIPITDIPPSSLHPVARTHPESKRTALFVNPHFTTNFEGMSREESAPLLDFLAQHASKPENVYRHRWAVGDVLMWDNRASMHYAVRDYDENMPRLMHRTTAGGDAPY